MYILSVLSPVNLKIDLLLQSMTKTLGHPQSDMFKCVIPAQAGTLLHSDYHRLLACGNAPGFDWAKFGSSLEGRVCTLPASSLLLSRS